VKRTDANTITPEEAPVRRLADFPDYGTRAELAAFTGLSVATLARYATQKDGPRITRMGRQAIRYKREDVAEWLDSLRKARTA
jgi:predicted DNA-binding transcriptional regulator AlpA